MGSIFCCNNPFNNIQETDTMKVAEYSWDQRKKLDPKDFTIENITNDYTGRLPGTINGEQFIIQNCKNSRIYLLDNIGTISIDDCTHCDIIVGPVKTSIFIRDCSHCNIIVACQQFRTRDCHHLNVFLCCTSQPIIESSTKFKVAPYQLYYPELASQFKLAGLSPFNCNWSEIYDFTPVSDQGLNFSHLSDDVRPFQLLSHPASVFNRDVNIDQGDSVQESEFSKKISTLEVTDVKEQSIVPYTYGSRRSVGTTETTKQVSLVVIFYDVNQGLLAHDIIKYISQNSSTLFLVKTRETKLSMDVAKRLFEHRTSVHDLALKGPIVSLEYVGSASVNGVLEGYTGQNIAIQNIKNLIYVSPDKETSMFQRDLINNVAQMGMNTA